jgi:hypothetical protein
MRVVPVLWHETSVKITSPKHLPLEHVAISVVCRSGKCFCTGSGH